MAVTASGRFIAVVARSFDETVGLAETNLSVVPPRGPKKVERIFQQALDLIQQAIDWIRNKQTEELPEPLEEFKPLIAQNFFSMTEWFDFTGIFDPSKPIKEATIETCARDRLEMFYGKVTNTLQTLEKRQSTLEKDIERVRPRYPRLVTEFNNQLIDCNHLYAQWQRVQTQLETMIRAYDDFLYDDSKKKIRKDDNPFKVEIWKAEVTGKLQEKRAKRTELDETLTNARVQVERDNHREAQLTLEIATLDFQIRFLDTRKKELEAAVAPSTAQKQLLTFVFQTAFKAPSATEAQQETQRDAIIAGLEPYKSMTDASASWKQRLYFKISRPVIATLTSSSFMGLLGILLLHQSRNFYQWFGTTLVSSSLGILVSAKITLLSGFLPPLALKCLSVAATAFAWIATHQFLLYITLCIAAAILGENLLDDMLGLFIMTVGLLGAFSVIPAIVLHRFGLWWAQKNTQLRTNRDKIDEPEALECWLRMAEIVAEQRKAVETKTPAQPVQSIQRTV